MTAEFEKDQQSGIELRLLATLEQLLEIDAIDIKGALNQASQLIAEALQADKVDAFLYDPAIESLVAVGTSDTPMARLQRSIGMDRLPLANGGRAVEVFRTGKPYRTGQAEQDPQELIGITKGLGVRSSLYVAFDVLKAHRGVLGVASAQAGKFAEADLHFLQAVARWFGALVHRVELVERVSQSAALQIRRLAAEELLMVLSHDLRNYLAPLAGRIELLRRSAERDDRIADLRNATAATEALDRLQHMIAELLDAGRLDQGLFTLATQPLNVALLAFETAALLQTGDATIQVEGPEEAWVIGDPDRLRQALENLLSNALKHSPPGATVDLQIATQAADDGSWVVLTIRDQGPGIPADLLPKLFSRFARGKGSTGLGLGLYLARGIAEAHGGTLTADAAPGAGATFRLRLPLPQNAENAAPVR